MNTINLITCFFCVALGYFIGGKLFSLIDSRFKLAYAVYKDILDTAYEICVDYIIYASKNGQYDKKYHDEYLVPMWESISRMPPKKITNLVLSFKKIVPENLLTKGQLKFLNLKFE